MFWFLFEKNRTRETEVIEQYMYKQDFVFILTRILGSFLAWLLVCNIFRRLLV
jgi:hypothetical protein